jgi:hypothetical protein
MFVRGGQPRHMENEQLCLEAKALNLFYGDKQALFDVNMQIPKHAGYRLHRAVRLRQIDLVAHLQSHERPD